MKFTYTQENKVPTSLYFYSKDKPALNTTQSTNHKLLWHYLLLWRKKKKRPPSPLSSSTPAKFFYWMTQTTHFRLHPSFCLKLGSKSIESPHPPTDILIAGMSSEQAELCRDRAKPDEPAALSKIRWQSDSEKKKKRKTDWAVMNWGLVGEDRGPCLEVYAKVG